MTSVVAWYFQMRRGWLVYLVRLSSFRFPRTRFVYERESAFPLGPRAFSLAGAGNLKREMRQQRNYERLSFLFASWEARSTARRHVGTRKDVISAVAALLKLVSLLSES